MVSILKQRTDTTNYLDQRVPESDLTGSPWASGSVDGFCGEAFFAFGLNIPRIVSSALTCSHLADQIAF